MNEAILKRAGEIYEESRAKNACKDTLYAGLVTPVRIPAWNDLDLTSWFERVMHEHAVATAERMIKQEDGARCSKEAAEQKAAVIRETGIEKRARFRRLFDAMVAKGHTPRMDGDDDFHHFGSDHCDGPGCATCHWWFCRNCSNWPHEETILTKIPQCDGADDD
jgi:hypothetical protein